MRHRIRDQDCPLRRFLNRTNRHYPRKRLMILMNMQWLTTWLRLILLNLRRRLLNEEVILSSQVKTRKTRKMWIFSRSFHLATMRTSQRLVPKRAIRKISREVIKINLWNQSLRLTQILRKTIVKRGIWKLELKHINWVRGKINHRNNNINRINGRNGAEILIIKTQMYQRKLWEM